MAQARNMSFEATIRARFDAETHARLEAVAARRFSGTSAVVRQCVALALPQLERIEGLIPTKQANHDPAQAELPMPASAA